MPDMFSYETETQVHRFPIKVTKETTKTYDEEGRLIEEVVVEISEYEGSYTNAPRTSNPITRNYSIQGTIPCSDDT